MINLHIVNKNYSSWSLHPWVLMKTLGLHFEEVKQLAITYEMPYHLFLPKETA